MSNKLLMNNQQQEYLTVIIVSHGDDCDYAYCINSLSSK